MIRVRRGDYGYDAPYFPVLFGLLSIAAGLGATISWRQGVIRPAMQMTLYFVFFLANTSSFLYTTRRGKFLEWDRILDRLHLRGDEGVLDMGCGRGAVLTAVARRLTTGRVTGVDIWSKKDQSGNAKRRHPAQRVPRRCGRSRTDRDWGYARASVSGCDLRSRRLEPRYPQHPIECRSQTGDRRRLSCPETWRPDSNRGHPCHGAVPWLSVCPAIAQRDPARPLISDRMAFSAAVLRRTGTVVSPSVFLMPGSPFG